MRKSGKLYAFILGIWGAFSLLLIEYLVRECRAANSFMVGFLLTISILVLIIFWLGSVRDLLFSLCYALKKKQFRRIISPYAEHKIVGAPRVLLLYCTANDFNPHALEASMEQTYLHTETIILDDSSKSSYIKAIDEFSKIHRLTVVRRATKIGFKAGNLNNYLRGREDYDYFVVLDSDEIIPKTYVEDVLRYFSAMPCVGAVQAAHAATHGKNVFQRLLGMSVKSNGATAQVVKQFYGANALMGHGMTLSRDCYLATGGFPHVVAEDISMAVLIKNAGFDIAYAPHILCYEEFPYDYAALKKRQCKWTQGNLEYMRKYHHDIIRSNMAWFEKLDMMLSHYMLPLTPVLSLLLVVVNILLGLFDYEVIRHSVFIYSLMTVFLLSPLIPDIFVYGKTKEALWLLPYFALNIITYASMAPMMLRTVFSGMLGKPATFIITPKQKRSFTLYETLCCTIDSLLFAFALAMFSLWSSGTIIPSILLLGGCALAPFAVLLANIKTAPKIAYPS